MKRAGSLRVNPDEKWKGLPFESKPRFEKIRNIKKWKGLAVRGKPRYKNEENWPLEVSPDENERNWPLQVSPDMKMKRTDR